MTNESNKQIVRRFFELFNAGEINAMNQVYAEDVVDHDPVPMQPEGLAGVRIVLNAFRAAFPDMTVTIEHLVADGDLVTSRQTARGTQQGELLGIPPTGKRVELKAFDMYRIRDGKIVEVWHLEDMLGLMMQLGAIPAPQPAAP